MFLFESVTGKLQSHNQALHASGITAVFENQKENQNQSQMKNFPIKLI